MNKQAVFALSILLLSPTLWADTGSKLLATGGITSFEGSAGGGITPWALIAGYASQEEVNATANVQRLDVGEYQLSTYGAAVGAYDRFEFSLQKQSLDVSSGVVTNVFNAVTGGPTPALIAPSTKIEQTIIGAKYKLFGDAIYDANPFLPQVSVGIQYKTNNSFDNSLALYNGAIPAPNTGVPMLLGAKEGSGTDVYVSATKVWLGLANGKNVLLNATARYSKANTFGLLGFGSATDDSYELEWAASLAMFTGTNTIVGMEVRQQADRLGGLASTDTVTDFFITYLPSKEWSITAAYVDLGNLPFQPDTSGLYLSITANL
ncbi:DUF3034 family protein [Psychrosphaera ytuae]|uniref:DUF3034 family protein n=1 Tax=Psychrosphaera ytuae TaxID=2820710 RepID=A0A975DDE1_9GAMM|nr:DUF3034 family protein [Psychrosphaera ytuae]QTH65105.1 DUF3034 family protein [Psychrosphaera ytuae]